MRNLTPQICYRQSEGFGGGKGSDPRDGDERLVKWFKAALSAQRSQPSSTANPYGLISAVREICERADTAISLIFLDKDLVPIAQRLKEINPGDRDIPGVVTWKFEDYEI